MQFTEELTLNREGSCAGSSGSRTGEDCPFIDAWVTEEVAYELISAGDMLSQTIAAEGKPMLIDALPKAPSTFEMSVPLDVVTSYGVSVHAEIAIRAGYPSCYPIENTRECPQSSAQTPSRCRWIPTQRSAAGAKARSAEKSVPGSHFQKNVGCRPMAPSIRRAIE